MTGGGSDEFGGSERSAKSGAAGVVFFGVVAAD
jgi:hypothetical protein